MASGASASTSSAPSSSSASRASGKPRTRQRVYKAPPVLDVPDIDQDAAERKRVLNVLAQRRYRERKRQDRMKANGKGTEDEAQDTPSKGSEVSGPEPAEDFEVIGNMAQPSPPHSQPSVDGGVALMDLELTDWDSLDNSDISSLLPESTAALTDFPGGQTSADDAFALPAFSGAAEDFSVQFSPPMSLDSLSTSSSSDFEFPDSYLLPVHELTLLKALMRISQRIGCESQSIWSLDCISPFYQGQGTPAEQLPESWRPTASQISVPHHPVVDLLPWPTARDRILMFMALPDAARPPNAQGPMALVNFVYDLEDNSEGVRVYGADPCDPGSWEVGQLLFERWWFLFDRDIIATSNRWRQLRGAPPLLLKGQ